jgi:hypothetical protein
MRLGARLTAIALGTAAAVALIFAYVYGYLLHQPKLEAAAATSSSANLTLQTVASFGHSPHPDWVSYLMKKPDGQWAHTTIWRVPAHSVVHVTIYQYDTATGLRNPFLGQPRGILGGTMTVDGKKLRVLDPDLASHTFTIPDLGVSVPLKGVADDAPNQCAVTPCTMQQAHTTVQFSFRTGKPGHYRWQCFVPCGAGWVNGFGGPMQTIGWMDGYLVVA